MGGWHLQESWDLLCERLHDVHPTAGVGGRRRRRGVSKADLGFEYLIGWKTTLLTNCMPPSYIIP